MTANPDTTSPSDGPARFVSIMKLTGPKRLAGSLIRRACSDTGAAPTRVAFRAGIDSLPPLVQHVAALDDGRGVLLPEAGTKLVKISFSHFPTKCLRSFSFSSHTYSISSVSARVSSRLTLHGLV